MDSLHQTLPTAEAVALPTSDDALLTLRELAAYLRRHEMVVWREVRAGRIPAFKLANRWMVRVGAIRTWIREQEESATAAGAAR